MAVAVYVVQRQCYGEAPPFAQPARLTAARLDSSVEQALLQVTAVAARASDEQLLKRYPGRTGSDQPTAYRFVPRPPVESKPGAAFRHAVALLVVGANRPPVIPPPASLVDLFAELGGVIGNGRSGYTQQLGHGGATVAGL
jgi:hypothetical protein